MHLQNARPEERVIRQFTVSGRYSLIQILAAGAVFGLFYGLAMLVISAKFFGEPSGSLRWALGTPGALAALYLMLSALYLRLARRYFLTTQRVIEVEGFLSQRSSSADYANITDITVLQDVFERFVSATGTVEINTAGGPAKELRLIHVDNPIGVRDQVLELSEKAKRLLAQIRAQGEDRPVNVAPTSAAFPIATDPEIVDTDNNAVIDIDEARVREHSGSEAGNHTPGVKEGPAGIDPAQPIDESRPS